MEMTRRERSFQRLLEHGENAALILDARGRVTYCTPAIERWLDASIPLAGSRPLHLLHPEEAPDLLQAFNELIRIPRATKTLALRARGAAGEWRTLDVTATNALDDDAISGVMIFARDVTDAERLRDSLCHAQRMELTGRLASGIAHEFNNALTIIMGHADLLEANARAAGWLDVSEIRNAARRAATLARRLLSLGRKHRGCATDVDVNGVLESLYRTLEPVIGAQISFAYTPSAVPVSVRIDPVRLDQALVNLILNARDAITDHGAIRIDAEYLSGFRVEGSTRSQWARIRVSGSGSEHGTSVCTSEWAWAPQFTARHAVGSGVGLAIVRETVVEAGGTITIASAADDPGTTVDILLPATQVADEATDATTAPSGGRETIVLVEDDNAVRQSIARTLHDAGYDVVEVPTVIEGVWLSDDVLSRAGLVIADEVLPDSSGHELVATFRHRQPGIRVLHISGYPLTEQLARHLDDHTDFLAKPFDRAALLRCARRLLDTA
jgi:two-component system cell cycle sensor histidine kinase/response regulator CckA